jgi:ABC-type antimicrobial peptide transport system permease subunit
LEALKNGVPLYFEIAINIRKKNQWWIDSSVSKLSQVYKVQYFELAKLYQLSNLNTEQQSNFLFFGSVLLEIGNITHFPLVDTVLLTEGKEYYAEVIVDLILSKLPLPLIPIAFTGSDWEHKSSTYRLPLE